MKSRLFCLGDSFVDWEIPKLHWTYYLSKHYDVNKFGKSGSDNYSIIFQLGCLPDYASGDRIIIVFTDPGRLPRRFYGERHETFFNNPYKSPSFYKDKKFAEKLDKLNLIEGDRWINGDRENEIKFLKKLQQWLKDYNPVFFTWSDQFYKSTSDFVSLIKVSSNWDEGVGEKIDFHPGPIGCYEIYKKLHELLKVEEPLVDFEMEEKENKLI